MNRRVPYIPLRRPVFIGCEGASEASYAAFLQDLISDAGLPIHLIIEELGPGAGDPLSRIEMAVRRLDQLRKTRTAPRQRFAMLDSDQADRDRQRADRARQTAIENNIVILWQRPCFEAMLLRHLEGRSAHRPPGTPAASQALRKEWPEYEKPMTRAALAKRIDRAAVLRAAAVEPELKVLLRCIALL
jgi:hypothetical protein